MEEKAVCYLEGNGIKIIKRNLRSPWGEVDIIGVDEQTLVFIEVKSWVDGDLDSLAYQIHKKKQLKIIQTARWFMEDYSEPFEDVRFDALFINSTSTQWIKHAFEG